MENEDWRKILNGRTEKEASMVEKNMKKSYEKRKEKHGTIKT